MAWVQRLHELQRYEPVNLVMGGSRLSRGIGGRGDRVGVDVSGEKEKGWDEGIGEGRLPLWGIGCGS